MMIADQFPVPKVGFEEIDTNDSGFISYYELAQFLKTTVYPGKAIKNSNSVSKTVSI